MSLAAVFAPPETLRTSRAARNTLTAIRKQMLQAMFIGWPELAESFRKDEARMLEYMRSQNWVAREDAK